MSVGELLAVEKSTHRVEVVPLRLEPHPNADSLSIVRIFDGYTVCVRTADWEHRGDRAAYVPPDSIVPDTPDYAWLNGKRHIKVKRLRGILSMGMLVPAPPGAEIGDDVAAQLGITHYEPAVHLHMGEDEAPPPGGFRPVYDLDTLRRYAAAFIHGEPVVVTEKLHGANGRFCYVNDRMYAGSKNNWKKVDKNNLWWRALNIGVEAFCMHHPNVTVYGEVYGQVQDLHYGTRSGEVRLAVFDVFQGATWWPFHRLQEAARRFEFEVVPVIANPAPFVLEDILALAEGKSLVPGAEHVREGCVVRPDVERMHPTVGRVHLKVVGNGYLERS